MEDPAQQVTRRAHATDWGGGAVVWGLSINKGCADMNLQVVLGHSGNRETGGKEHESADTTLLASLHE